MLNPKHCQIFSCFNYFIFVTIFKLLLLIFALSIDAAIEDDVNINPTLIIPVEVLIPEFNDDDNITADLIKHGIVAQAEPAIWGDAAPDYSLTILDEKPIYIYALIFVDSKITRHYSNDMGIIKTEIMRMIKEANNYFSQLNIRISVVDVLQTMRDDLSLYTFQSFHTSKLVNLPYHNFAALISFRYAGGLAYVDGMCSYRNSLLCGFYPHNPEAMGAIFFHETAHLLGVGHDDKNKTLNLTNCICYDPILSESIYNAETYRPSAGCLKIPGYDHDCTAQYLANIVHRNRCLPKEPRRESENVADGFRDWTPFYDSKLAICGNGVIEGEEECDCGIKKFCNEINCIPETCKRKISFYVIFLACFLVCCILLTLLSICCYYILKQISTKVSSTMRPSFRSKKWRFCKIAAEPLRILKRLFFVKSENRNRRPKNISNPLGQNEKLSTETIVTLVPKEINQIGSTETLRTTPRPKMPPPPPPIAAKPKPERPPRPVFIPIRTAPPPPPPPISTKPKLTPCSIPSIMEPPPSIIPEIQMRMNEVLWAEYEERISHKFADFTEEFASSDDEEM